MCLIPVLDLMIGQVVLAQGGNRNAYRPVHSRLTTSSLPLDVARAIFNQTGCDWLYLADLDSFAGAAPNWSVYSELTAAGFGLWIDADWITKARFRTIEQHLDTERVKVIVSSETLSEQQQFSVFDELLGSGITPIFSLDKKGDAVVSQAGNLAEQSPLQLVRSAHGRGVGEFIVLDLNEVGTGNGFQSGNSSSELIAQVKQEFPDAVITSGGGVRDRQDIQRWVDIGCDHVLVASAIHAGTLSPDDASQFSRSPPG